GLQVVLTSRSIEDYGYTPEEIIGCDMSFIFPAGDDSIQIQKAIILVNNQRDTIRGMDCPINAPNVHNG
ncbi:unnamed protein product, partial [Heterosigma akashiwo]